MQYRYIAAMALAAPMASAYQVTVNNNCGFDAYLWSVGDSVGNMVTLKSGSGTWSQNYYTRSNGGGPCIKISPDNNLWSGGPIAQLEYKWDSALGNLWYDLSNINGLPFKGSPISMYTSDNSCPKVTCDSSGKCNNAYYKPDDNLATLSCGGADIVMDLCPGGAGGDESKTGHAFVEKPTPVTPAVVTQYAAKVVTEVVTATADAIAAPAGHPNAVYIDQDGVIHDKQKRGHIHKHLPRSSRHFSRHLRK